MKKFLLAMLAAIAVCPAFAVTRDQLLQKNCSCLLYGTAIEYSSIKNRYSFTTRAGSAANEIVIENFLGIFDLTLTFDQSKNTLSFKKVTTFTGNGNFSSYRNIRITPRTFTNANYWNSNGTVAGLQYCEVYAEKNMTTITGTGSTEGDFIKYTFANLDSDGLIDGFVLDVDKSNQVLDYFGGFELYFYDAPDNAELTLSTNEKQQYNVCLDVVENNKLLITNILNTGIDYLTEYDSYNDYVEQEMSHVYATLNWNDNTVEILSEEVGGRIYGAGQYYGTATLYDSYGYSAGRPTGYFEIQPDMNIDFHFLTSGVEGTWCKPVTGTYELFNPTHVGDANHWASHGGAKSTMCGIKLNLGKIGLVDDGINWVKEGKSLTITADRPLVDITHQCTVNLKHFGYGPVGTNTENHIYIKGEVTPDKNIDHVVEYQLHIMPGTYNVVSGTSFANLEKGHDNAFNIEDPRFYTNFDPDVDPATLSLNNLKGIKRLANDGDEQNTGLSFNRLVPESALNHTDPNGNYTIFVKTIYSDESGLTPTYHALTPLGAPTTGINDIGNSEDFGTPRYFNMQGIEVEQPTPGIYLVKRGNKITKETIK